LALFSFPSGRRGVTHTLRHVSIFLMFLGRKFQTG